jgi:hypothetical protein
MAARRPTIGWTWRIAAASALLAASCHGQPAGQRAHKQTPKAGTALVSNFQEGSQRFSLSLVVGGVLLDAVEELKVNEDIEIVSVVPTKATNGLELRDARFARVIDADGTPHYRHTLSGGCFDSWPPPGFGPTYPARGAFLRRGETVAVGIYLQPRRVGMLVSEGLTVTYTAPGGKHARVQHFTHSVDETVNAVASTAELPAYDAEAPPPCAPVFPRWLQPSDERCADARRRARCPG